MLLSDVCLFVCLSVAYIGPTSRIQRPRKIKIGTEIAHVTRDLDTTFKVKGHQAALLSAALTRKAAAAVGVWERIRRGKVLLRCVCSAAREELGCPRGRRGAGAYCVATHTAY